MQRLSRLRTYLLFEFLLSVFIGKGKGRKATVTKRSLDHLHAQVTDQTLRAKLTPHYEVGCKRLLLSDDYYPSLTQPNVEVVDSPVASFTAHEVVGTDGIARPVDVVIMGTGFEAAEPPYAEHIVGRDGVRLSELWKTNGVEAYAGSTVNGFPNLFLMIGPNATLAHNSMIYMIESHINYIASALAFCRRPGVGSVEVKPAVQQRYNEALQAKLAHSVWVEGGCGSWYLDHRGANTTLWPDHTWRFRRLTRRFHPGQYTVRSVITLEPIGVVVGGRGEAIDDDWGQVEAVIALDTDRFDADAVAGLDAFSHLCVVFQFHLVAEADVVSGARHPRGNQAWPKVGMFAQRAKMRPNRLGVSNCELISVDGLSLTVRGLDAVDGTPVLDIKPFMAEFEPTGEIRQPAWATELMAGYF